MKKKAALLIIIGILAIALSIVSFCMDAGYDISYQQYGGDAYTGMQNASARTANNVVYLCKVVKFGFGSILLVSGLTLIVAGIGAVTKDDLKSVFLKSFIEEYSNSSEKITSADSSSNQAENAIHDSNSVM